MNPSAETFVPRDGPILNPNAVIFGPSQRQVPLGYDHGDGFVQGQVETGRVGYDGVYDGTFYDQMSEVHQVQGVVWLDQSPVQQYEYTPNQQASFDQGQVANNIHYDDRHRLGLGPYEETPEHPLGRLQREKSQHEKGHVWEKSYVQGHQDHVIGYPQHFHAGAYPPGPVQYELDEYGRAFDSYGNYNAMASTPDTSFNNAFAQSNNYRAQTFGKSHRGGKKKPKRKLRHGRGVRQGYTGGSKQQEGQNDLAQQTSELSLSDEAPVYSKIQSLKNGFMSDSAPEAILSVGRDTNKQALKNGSARDATLEEVILGKPSSFKQEGANVGTVGNATTEHCITLNDEKPIAITDKHARFEDAEEPVSSKSHDGTKQGDESDSTPQMVSTNSEEPSALKQQESKNDITTKAALDQNISAGKADSSQNKKRGAKKNREAALQAAFPLDGEKSKPSKKKKEPLRELTNAITEGEVKDHMQKKHNGDENNNTLLDGLTKTDWAKEVQSLFDQDQAGGKTSKW